MDFFSFGFVSLGTVRANNLHKQLRFSFIVSTIVFYVCVQINWFPNETTQTCWSNYDLAADSARGKWTTEWYSCEVWTINHRFLLRCSTIFNSMQPFNVPLCMDGQMQKLFRFFLLNSVFSLLYIEPMLTT